VASGTTAISNDLNTSDGERVADRATTRVTAAQSLTPVRLVIEKDPSSGVFIQRHLDKETGELLFQWPNDSWLKLREEFEAKSGTTVDRKV
jgi:hypothetical protein